MFDYKNAFSRNLGWVSEETQEILSKNVIGIAGAGGVGGHHLHSLVRMGFKRFKIADFDHFEVHNFNRQFGSDLDSIGKNKALVLKQRMLKINPEVQIDVYEQGITKDNQKEFLEEINILIDGLDLYAVKERITFFDMALKMDIPVVIAGPFGFGTSGTVFKPNGPLFSTFCDLTESMNTKQMVCRFLAAICPRPIHISYLKEKDYVNMEAKKVPSIHPGVTAATTFAATECFKIATGQGVPNYIPKTIQIDFFKGKLRICRRRRGNKSFIQKLLIFFMERMWQKMS